MPKKIEPRITKYMELCIICGKPAQWHHAIHTPQGSRDKASADGLLLPLCEDHHEGYAEPISAQLSIRSAG